MSGRSPQQLVALSIGSSTMDLSMNKNIEKVSDTSVNTAITEALLKLKKDMPKDGVDLLNITRKLSSKKFGKK